MNEPDTSSGHQWRRVWRRYECNRPENYFWYRPWIIAHWHWEVTQGRKTKP